MKAQIEENKNCRQKIQSTNARCQEMVKLSPEMKASAMIRKEVQELKKKMSEELALIRNSQGAFAAKCFAVQRKESDITLSFHCIDLLGHTGEVKAVEFSGDGTLLASVVVTASSACGLSVKMPRLGALPSPQFKWILVTNVPFTDWPLLRTTVASSVLDSTGKSLSMTSRREFLIKYPIMNSSTNLLHMFVFIH